MEKFHRINLGYQNAHKIMQLNSDWRKSVNNIKSLGVKPEFETSTSKFRESF